jgi:hypothetical protein
MTQRSRRIAALGMLLASCLAILATTPGEPTAYASVEGDVAVALDMATEVVVRFVVAPEGAAEIDRGSMYLVTGSYGSPIDVIVTAVADGVAVGPDDVSSLALPLGACRDGCDVDMRAVMTWIGPPGDGVRTRWNAKLAVVYENSVPQGEPVTATTIQGDWPPGGRHVWLVVGAFIVGLSGAGWIGLGGRLARVRLGLAALGVLPPAWLLLRFASAGLGRLLLQSDYEDLLGIAVAILLVIGLGVGLVRTARGDPVALPAAGWAYLVIAGYCLWLVVENFATYRPHELALLAVGLGIPGIAALTAVPPAKPIVPARLRFGTSFVMAALIAEFAVTVGVASVLIVGFVISAVGRGAIADVFSVLLGLIPILVAAGFVIGFRRWPSGDLRFLGAVSTATLLVFVPLLLFIFTNQGGLIVITVELAAVVVICFVVNLVGLVGLLIFPAPGQPDGPRAAPTDDERHDEGGQGDEVAGVPGELDVDRSGDRA